MELDQVKQLMDHLEASKLKKLVFKKGDFELHLEKESSQSISSTRQMSAELESAFQSEVALKGERGGSSRVDAPGTYITSPMVGTFYTSPAPDQPPFVREGDQVDENSVVCIVEAMKVMNEVKAGVRGTIVEVLTESSQPVEFGTRLFRIV